MNAWVMAGSWEPEQLWTRVTLLVVAGCLASWAWVAWRARRVRRRIRLVLGERGDAPGDGQSRTGTRQVSGSRPTQATAQGRGGPRRWWTWWTDSGQVRAGAAATGAFALAATLVDGVAGWLAGAVCAYCVWRWASERAGRRDTVEETGARAAAGQLPLTAELMAACLAAGSSPAQAADAVGRSVGGPLGIRLTRAATELHLGAEPRSVWRQFRSLPGGQAFARCMERAGAGGVPAVEPVTRLAAELRAGQARAATAKARRAAVLVTGPLGLCFLPAFLAVGVAPVVMGLARSLT
jgi:Flp pilus assembly protein TadB